MPKSKRSKVVQLTRVKKNARSVKEGLVQTIRQYLDRFARVFLFTYQGLRSTPLRKLKQNLNSSKLCLGKLRVMAIALGRTEQEEIMPNLNYIASKLKGNSGLLFTNHKPAQIQKFVNSFSVPQYAMAGHISQKTIVLQKGDKTLQKMGHTMAPYLRSLGLNIKLDNQKLILQDNFILAQQGMALTPQKCKLLKLFDIKLAQFRVQLEGVWQKSTHSVQLYD